MCRQRQQRNETVRSKNVNFIYDYAILYEYDTDGDGLRCYSPELGRN